MKVAAKDIKPGDVIDVYAFLGEPGLLTFTVEATNQLDDGGDVYVVMSSAGKRWATFLAADHQMTIVTTPNSELTLNEGE